MKRCIVPFIVTLKMNYKERLKGENYDKHNRL